MHVIQQHHKRTEQISLVLSPAQLAEYATIDPALPSMVVRLRGEELQRNSRYAVLALLAGLAIVFGCIAGFIYLVMHGHAGSAALLLGGGVLGLALGFVRSRL